MSSTDLNPLEQLLRLTGSPLKFNYEVSKILHGEEYKQWAKHINDADVVELVNFLDRALDTLDPASYSFRRCLRELRHICGARMILPTSYTLSSQVLTVGHHPLAPGGTGDVYEGMLSGLKVCVKRVRVYSVDGPEKAIKALYQEAIMWKHLEHKNIVPLLGITVAPLQLISEWMQGGGLTEYIGKHKDLNRLSLVCDVAEGLHYLHSRDVVHSDIRGPNVLVDDTGHARITGFGIATVSQNLDSIRIASDEQGPTARWAAPEILIEEGTYTKEADVFSFAMVVIEVFTGDVPFHRSPPAAAILAIMKGIRPPRPTHSQFTDDLWRLVQCCWDQDPYTRPEVSWILAVLESQNAETPEPPSPVLAGRGADRLNELHRGRSDQARGLIGGRGKSLTSPNNTLERELDGKVSGDEALSGRTLETNPLGMEAHPVGDPFQQVLPTRAKALEVLGDPAPPTTKPSIYNVGTSSSPPFLSLGQSINRSAVLISPDTMGLGGLLSSSNPPPLKFAMIANESKVHPARELTARIDMGYQSANAPMDLSPNGSQEGSGTDHSAFSTPQLPLRLDLEASACKRLITHEFSRTELVPLIGEIFTSQDEVKSIGYLRGDDAQAFIDIMDEALDRTDLSPWLRRKCLSALCKICGRHALLPRSLRIPFCYDRSGTPLYHGGYADVWKGEDRGRQVAVKVLRVYSRGDFGKITSRFCKEVVTWKALRHPNVLPLLGVIMDHTLSLFAMVSEWMENGNIIEFIRDHQDANRFELLKDVANGLIYIHSQAMIHGDLKGANILIDQSGRACLGDFGLLTVVSDPTNPTASNSSVKGGTMRWMSPELLNPDQYGIMDSRPTKESDSYALGMVILEVLSGRSPFNQYRDVIVMRMVLDGIRPERPNGPEGVWFTDDLWRLLASCWESQRERRPTIEAILEFLGQVSDAWEPPAPQVDEDVEMWEDDWDLTNSSELVPPFCSLSVDSLEGAPPEGIRHSESRGLTSLERLAAAFGLGEGTSSPSTRPTTPAADRGNHSNLEADIGSRMPDTRPQQSGGVKEDTERKGVGHKKSWKDPVLAKSSKAAEEAAKVALQEEHPDSSGSTAAVNLRIDPISHSCLTTSELSTQPQQKVEGKGPPALDSNCISRAPTHPRSKLDHKPSTDQKTPKTRWDELRRRSRNVNPDGGSRKGYDNGSSGLTVSPPYRWQDLMVPDLPPMGFDTVLLCVLRSTTEMEKIKGLNQEELQGVIDVLDQYLKTRDVMNGLGKKCFTSLCEMCTTREVLPTSHMLNPSDLQRPEEENYAGGFGIVWKGEYNGAVVAIKRLNIAQLDTLKKRFCHEVIMWKMLSNPNILPFLGAYMRGLELVMVSDWMENGNIRQYLRRNPHENRLSLLMDIVRGVVYLHSMNVVHGDLKGENILVKDDGVACLADFGLMSIALDLETTDIISGSGRTAKGTYRWMSPELFDPSRFGRSKVRLTKASDCYATGIVIYEVLSGKIPFEEIEHWWMVPQKVLEGTRPSVPEHHTHSKMVELWKLAQECWTHYPEDRPSSPTVLDRLNTFALVENVTPFALREPRPMRMKGQPTETTTEWEAPLTSSLPKVTSPIVPVTDPSPSTAVIPSQLQADASVDKFGVGLKAKFKRATTKLSKFWLR